jgi:hypothetical protein
MFDVSIFWENYFLACLMITNAESSIKKEATLLTTI